LYDRQESNNMCKNVSTDMQIMLNKVLLVLLFISELILYHTKGYFKVQKSYQCYSLIALLIVNTD